MTHEIELVVNGNQEQLSVEPRVTLADALRGQLGLTGTHLGCEQGGCGACTVLLSGRPVRSCLMLAVQADGDDIETIEGLGRVGASHPLQEAFLQQRGFQCGFCTPGMVMTVLACAREDRNWDEPELREHLAGNICRCTGYDSIVASAAEYLRAQGKWTDSPEGTS
jgi:carbon-monoxide dehydrogenase small subunit